MSVLELRYDTGQGYLLGPPQAAMEMRGVALFELISATDAAEVSAA